MPKLNSIAPTFPVADVDATIRWYETQRADRIDAPAFEYDYLDQNQ